MWLKMVAACDKDGVEPDIAQAKPYLCRYFFERELPLVDYLIERIQGHSQAIMGMPEDLF